VSVNGIDNFLGLDAGWGMARKLRIEYPGAIYHVLNRGDHREPVFRDEHDRERFIATLSEACAKTDWQVQAYCLMGNHFHLVSSGGSKPATCGHFKTSHSEAGDS